MGASENRAKEQADGAATDEPRWAAVLGRDASASFVYGVASTGVYCRPACPSRRPLRKNVTFYATSQAAENAGYRACKRCRPNDAAPATQAAGAMCTLLESRDAPPSLGELAAHVGLSPAHAHRVFVRATGLTPRAYREGLVRARVQASLRTSGSVSETAFAAGFSGPSRFYAHAARNLGMAPAQFRAGGHGLAIRFAVGACSLGAVLVASTVRGICAVLLGDDPAALATDLARRFPRAELEAAETAFETSVAAVVAIIDAQPGTAMDALPLDVQGTVFQERVWRALREIPPGTTNTYAQLAEAIGAPRSIRAVARACANNPVAVLVPCHRVVRSNGELAGYRWGLARKRALLTREASFSPVVNPQARKPRER
jgi:AraC family transcriptional regulator of adaptative response/methylated-DNA-[protein]-cysteine methyltransferase